MSGGLVNDAEIQPFTTEDAITYAGTLVMFATSGATGNVELCAAGSRAIGYAFTSTKHPITEVAQANVKVGIGSLINGRAIEVPLPATHDAIAYGDALETAANGCVVPKSGAGEIVGNALEAKAQNAGGFVKLRVDKYTAGS